MNTDAAAILERLGRLGVSVTLDGDELVARPGNKVPVELIPVLKEHKRDLVRYLQRQGYRQDFPGNSPTRREVHELITRLEAEGYVLCFSPILQDLVAFHERGPNRGG